jgi:hypothetical protein
LRRISAILLLALFGFSLTGFAFHSDPEANLPACCRRHGNHHCALATGGKTTGSGFHSNDRCPLFPALGVATTSGVQLRLTPRISVSAPDYARALLSRPADVRPRARRAAAHGERGPPSLSKQA